MSQDLISAVTSSSHEAVSQGRVQRLEDLVKRGDIKKASQEFEAYFLSYLLKVMRETVPKSPLTQNRMGEVFQSFYDESLGRQAAQAGGIGLARLIESSLEALHPQPIRDREMA